MTMVDVDVSLVKLIPPEVAIKAYDDVATKPLKQVGEIGEDALKAFRLIATLPLQYLAAYQDRLQVHLKKIRDKVPEERQIQAQPSLAGPILEKFKYLDDSNHLTKLYENLLARSIDKDRVNEAHPAFFNIIEQLAPDEAMILYVLKDGPLDYVSEMDLNATGSKFINKRHTSDPFPYDKLTFPDNFLLYYSHLKSLGLVAWPGVEETPTLANGKQIGLSQKSQLKLIDFGDMFVTACIPPEGFDIEV